MILETNQSQFFNETIYNQLQQSELTFPTLEYKGVEFAAMQRELQHVFNAD